MGKFSTEPLFGMTIRESATDGSDFTNPAADYRRLFLGEDGLLHVKDSAGTVTNPYSASSTFVGAKARNTATQNISTVTLTALALNTEEYDTSTFHDNATNNSRFTIPTTGKYLLEGFAYMASTGTGTTGSFQLLWRADGSTVLTPQVHEPHYVASRRLGMQVIVVASLTAAQYVELMMYQDSGNTVTTGDASDTANQNQGAVTLIGT